MILERVVLATGNPHKLEEYQALLPGLPIESLAGFEPMAEVVEDAPDFAGNAIKKALAAAAHTGLPALADDSGICVAALGGAPGVLSARYAAGSDQDRLEALLKAMDGVADRAAHFECVIAVAGLPESLPLPKDLERRGGCVIAHGVVRGTLTTTPRGQHGFGYDPIFELPSGRTAAELTAAEKHAISHRGRAVARMAPFLLGLTG